MDEKLSRILKKIDSGHLETVHELLHHLSADDPRRLLVDEEYDRACIAKAVLEKEACNNILKIFRGPLADMVERFQAHHQQMQWRHKQV